MTQILNIDAIKHQLGYFFDGLPHDQIIDVCDLIQNLSKKKQVNAFLNVWRSIIFSSNYIFGDEDRDESFEFAQEFDRALESALKFELFTFQKTKSKALIKQAKDFEFNYDDSTEKHLLKKDSVYLINTSSGDYYLSANLSTIVDKTLASMNYNLCDNFIVTFFSEVVNLINVINNLTGRLERLDSKVFNLAILCWRRILMVRPHTDRALNPLFISFQKSLSENEQYYGRPHSLINVEADSSFLSIENNQLLSQAYLSILCKDTPYDKLIKELLLSFTSTSLSKFSNIGNLEYNDAKLYWAFNIDEKEHIYDITYHFSRFLASLFDFGSQELFDGLLIEGTNVDVACNSIYFNTKQYFDDASSQSPLLTKIFENIDPKTFIDIGDKWFESCVLQAVSDGDLTPLPKSYNLDKMTVAEFLETGKLNDYCNNNFELQYPSLGNELLEQFINDYPNAFYSDKQAYFSSEPASENMAVSSNFAKYLKTINNDISNNINMFFIDKAEYFNITEKLVGFLVGRLNQCKNDFNTRKLFNNLNISHSSDVGYSIFYSSDVMPFKFSIRLKTIVSYCYLVKNYKQSHINIDQVYIDEILYRLNLYMKNIVCGPFYQEIQESILKGMRNGDLKKATKTELEELKNLSPELQKGVIALENVRNVLFSFSNEISQDIENLKMIALIYRLYNALDIDEDYQIQLDPILGLINDNNQSVNRYRNLIKECNFDFNTLVDMYYPFEFKSNYKKVNKSVLSKLLNGYMIGLNETIIDKNNWNDFIVEDKGLTKKNSEESIEDMNINIPTIGETVSNEHFTNRLKMALFGRNERIYLLNGISELEFINALNQDESSIPSMYLDAKNPILLKKDSYKFKDVLPAKLKERWECNKDGELAVFINLTLGDTVSTYKRPYFNNNIDMGYDLKDMEDLLSAFKELNLSDTKTTIFIYISNKLPDNTRSYISRLSFPIITLRPAGSKTIEENYIRYFFEQSDIKLSDFDKCYEKITRYIQKIGCDDKRGYDYIFDLIYSKAQIDGKKEIDSVYIENTLSQYCDYGVLNVNVESKVNAVELKDKLKEQIMGQDKAIEEISEQMMLASSGLTQSGFDKPLASFLFIGRSGTGKTETAIQLSKILGMELIRFDMSEYSSKHYADNLIGSPVGYIGSDRGGLLTNAVQKNPNSIILFDEIEKAHPSIQHKFYQILDYGMMTDAMGNKVDFTKTIVIFTTNTGANEKYSSFGMINDAETVARGKEEALKEAVSKQFDEALRGRIDKMITYQDLSKNVIEAILDKEINLIKERMSSIYRIGFEFVSSQAEVLKSYSSSIEAKLDDLIGVRDIKKELNSKLTKVLALALSNRNIVNGEPIKIDFVNNEFIVK